MNAKHLIAQSDRLIEAPDAMQLLRRFIVDLAVRGKLLAQDSTDEPSSELLRRVLEEKAQLARAGRPKAKKPLLEFEKSEVPFSVPKGWSWTRLETLSRRIHYGYTASAKKSVSDVRLLRITDIQHNSVDWPSVPGCEISLHKVSQYQLEPGDILFARTGGTVGKTFLVEDLPVTAVFASYLIRVQPSFEISPHYLKVFFESSLYWDQVRGGARGGAQPNVNGKILGRMSVTVPPHGEQQRIVTKVDELMAICDKLEATQAKRELYRDRLATVAQSRLVDASGDPAMFRTSARFYLDRLSRLTTRPEHVSEMRRTILAFAVRGRLLRQDSAMEPGSELSKRLREKSTEKGTVLVNGEGLFTIPCSWEWVSVDLVATIEMGQSPPSEHYNQIGQGIPFYQGKADFGIRSPTPRYWCTLPKKVAEAGDVLISVRAPVGPTNVANEKACIGRGLAALRPHDEVEREFLLLCLRSLEPELAELGFGTTFVAITKKQLASFLLPLPPLEEQQRIVAKVHELMTTCDELEERLREGATRRARLLEAVVYEALHSAA